VYVAASKIVPLINIMLKTKITYMLNIEGGIALDVACGTGMFTRDIAIKAKKVYGIDISVGMLRTAQKYAKLFNIHNIVFARANVENLPFEDEFFDGVSCIGALQLFTDLILVLREINRVLRTGGKFVGMTYLKRDIWAINDIYEEMKRKIKVHFFEVGELEDILEKLGFSKFYHEVYGSMILFQVEKI
jgi:ubiquinone/menaquinone biosynthesis C-methylase UbiE